MDACLQPAHQAEAVLETDLRAGVEAEEIAGQIAEISIAERPPETVRHAEGALEPRQAQRRRQRHDGEVGLRDAEIEIRVVVLGRAHWTATSANAKVEQNQCFHEISLSARRVRSSA